MQIYNLVFNNSNNLYSNSSTKIELWIDWIDINTELMVRKDFDLGYKFTMKTNPSGNFLVGTTYSLKDNIYFKINIQNNEPNNLKTNIMNYPIDSFGCNFWLSGNKFNVYFSNNMIVDNNIFTMDNNYSQRTCSTLNGFDELLSFAELSTKNKAFVVATYNYQFYKYSTIQTLIVCSLSNKTPLETVPLKDISNTINGSKQTFQTEPKFVFRIKTKTK